MFELYKPVAARLKTLQVDKHSVTPGVKDAHEPVASTSASDAIVRKADGNNGAIHTKVL